MPMFCRLRLTLRVLRPPLSVSIASDPASTTAPMSVCIVAERRTLRKLIASSRAVLRQAWYGIAMP